MMKKQLFYRLCALAACVACALGASAYDFESGGIYYNITGSNTVSLTHRSQYSSDYSGDFTIPSTVTHSGVTYTVTAIGNRAFYDCSNLTSVSIPTTVTTLENSAFYYCTALTSVEIPESVVSIGDWNFYMSDELTTVKLPSTLTSMGSYCFASCPKLTSVTCWATTPPSIGDYSFSSTDYAGLTLYVPEETINAYQSATGWSRWFGTITAIPDYDFTAYNLKFVITSETTAKVVGPLVSSPSGTWSIPDEANGYKVTEVGEEAFYDCTNITSITLGANVKVIGTYAFGRCWSLETVNLANATTIGIAAFSECRALKSISLPNTLTTIEDVAFDGAGLTSVTIPASVQTIGVNPFHSCQSLLSINVVYTNARYMSLNGVLFDNTFTELIAYPIGRTVTYYDVPEGITKIAPWAFRGSRLQSLLLPSSLTEISSLAFAENNQLTSITCMAHTPPVITGYTFFSTIENSGLTLSVPRNCVSAYQSAPYWQNFSNIQEQYYDFSVNGIYYNVIDAVGAKVEVTLKDEDGNSYSGSVTIPERVYFNNQNFTVSAIGDYAFAYSNNLTSVSLPSTVTSINYAAFYNCSKLSNINLPENLKTIGTYAFYYCTKLGNVEIPASVTTLGTYAFCGCSGSGFTEVVIPSSVTSVGYGAFYDCSNLTTVTIGSHVGSIGASAFHNCSALSKVITLAATPPSIQSGTFDTSHYSSVQLQVPRLSLSAYQSADYWKNFTTVTSMNYDFEEDGIFYNITSSGKVEVTYRDSGYNSYSGVVNIPETVTHNGVTYTVTAIGSNAFSESASLTAVTIPNTVTEIKSKAFYRCTGLSHVDIPNSVTTIGYAAFWLCTALEEAVIPHSVTTVSSMAFRNCSAMTYVVIGENVTSIGTTCFYYCPNITEVICLAATPPTLNDSGSQGTFMPDVYENAVLHVPYGSHEAYRNDAVWGKFTHVVSEEVVNPSIAGDVTGDGNIDISDATTLINYLLNGNSAGMDMDAADVTGDGDVDITDATTLINMLLNGTSAGTVGTSRVNYKINGAPFSMIQVDGGTFMMGDNSDSFSTPQHQVTLSSYCIGETEVTQALWRAVMGSNPSQHTGNLNRPVENINWNDCQNFVAALTELTGRTFRLPTEAEWEFAARGGKKSQGYTYAGSNILGEVAWYQDNSGNNTHPVATKAPNELGLYDMSGNVFEWCQDWYGSYTSAAQVNPQGPTSGEYRICRSSAYSRPANNWFKPFGRTYDDPTTKAADSGMRLASQVID